MGGNSTCHHEEQITAGYAAISERKYQEVIKLSTEGLDELMQGHILQFLDLRSTAFEKQGLLTRALDDAMRMIQYVPTSATGYLRAGSIHITNGKPNLAIDNYSNGLKAMSKEDPRCRQIREEHANALVRAQFRFDIVGNLPLELLHKVLTYLSPEHVWVCLNQTGTELDQAVCDAIPFVKHYILRLELANLSSSNLNKRYLEYLKNGVFTNLKMLSLKGAFFENITSEDLAIAIWQVRNTLVSLKINFGSGKSFPLLTVLGSCPNITKLSYTTNGKISLPDQGVHSEPRCTKLTDLELCYGGASYGALCSHLVSCPNLRRLVLLSSSTYGLGDPSNANKLTKYCPNLKILGLNCTEGLPEVKDSENSPYERGVVYMAIEFGRHFNITQATKHIEHQSHSLQQLTIFHPHRDAPNYGLYDTSRSSFRYRMLHALKYASDTNSSQPADGVVPPIEHFLGTIISNSPSLIDLSLVHVYGSTHLRTTLERITQARIQTLALKMVSFRRTGPLWYQSFFSSFQQVHTLTLGDCDVLNNGVLSSLASSESLRHLTVINCNDVTNSELIKFFKEVARRPSHQLNVLYFNDIPVSMDTSTIRALIKIKSLKSLILSNCRNINAESVNYLIREAPHSSLTTIEIRDCFPANISKPWLTSVSQLKEKGITLLID